MEKHSRHSYERQHVDEGKVENNIETGWKMCAGLLWV
jgi:hypothetical protein